MPFGNGYVALGADWITSSDGCRAAEGVVETARAGGAAPDQSVNARWREVLTATEDLIDLCWESDYSAMDAVLDAQTAAMTEVFAALEAAS